jgi:hypothetical protein
MSGNPSTGPGSLGTSNPNSGSGLYMSSEHTVVVHERTFLLSRTQIEFDSPNLFTHYFLETRRTRLLLSRNLDLFMLILDYLSGYTILPISDNALPQMSRGNVLKNLRVDAEYYSLKGLIELIDNHTPVNP